MKAEELMVGDYVHVKPSGMLIRVAAVHHKKVAYHACVSKLAWVRGDLLESIPLTTEILEKNGFIKENGYWVLRDKHTGDKIISLFEVAKGFAMSTSGLTIGFQEVHKFQHLLKLCGIEKTIEL